MLFAFPVACYRQKGLARLSDFWFGIWGLRSWDLEIQGSQLGRRGLGLNLGFRADVWFKVWGLRAENPGICFTEFVASESFASPQIHGSWNVPRKRDGLGAPYSVLWQCAWNMLILSEICRG